MILMLADALTLVLTNTLIDQNENLFLRRKLSLQTIEMILGWFSSSHKAIPRFNIEGRGLPYTLHIYNINDHTKHIYNINYHTNHMQYNAIYNLQLV